MEKKQLKDRMLSDKKLIGIVDDEPDILELVSISLNKAGYLITFDTSLIFCTLHGFC